MKKAIAALSVAAAFATGVQAGVLLWQVDTTDSVSLMDASVAEQPATWTYAMLKATSDTSLTYENVSDSSYGSTIANYVGDYDGTASKIGSSVFEDDIVAGDISSYSSSNYYIALYNSQNELVGYSELLLNSAASDFKQSSQFAADWGNINAWSGGQWVAVPEPTGGLMLLLGAALLGLKRKKLA